MITHPLAKHYRLVWCVAPQYGGLRDLVGGGVGTLQPAGAMGEGLSAQTVRSTNGDGTGGVYFPLPELVKASLADFSIVLFANFTTMDIFANALAIPDAGQPRLGLRKLTSSQMVLTINAGTNVSSSSSVFGGTDGWTQYAVTRSGSSVAFYKGIETWGTTATSTVIDYASATQIRLFNLEDNDGCVGDIAFAALFASALPADAVRELATDWQTLLKPRIVPMYSPPPPPPPPSPPPPPPPAPVAGLSASVTTGVAPLAVTFTDESTGSITSRALDVDTSGTIEATILPHTHTYTVPGIYTARLTVTNAGGSSNATVTISVYAEPPIASVPGIEYTVELDTGRDGFATAPAENVLTNRVISMKWSQGMKDAANDFAPPSQLTMELKNDDGAFNLEKPSAVYADGKFVNGMLVRVKAKHLTETVQLWVGKVDEITAAPGEYANAMGKAKRVQLKAQCPMSRLLAADYAPPLRTNITTSEALTMLFDNPTVLYPYDSTFGIIGASSIETGEHLFRLYINEIYEGETGLTTLAWVGDQSGEERKGRAQSFLRDVVQAEVGGRFFWQGRKGKFEFHNRLHDALSVLKADLSGATELIGARASYGKRLVNVVTVRTKPRKVGEENSVLWETTGATLRAEDSEKVFKARFTDPDNKDTKVGALVVKTPVPGIDIEARTGATKNAVTGAMEGGTQVGSSLIVLVDATGSGATVTVRSGLGQEVLIDRLVLRGTPLLSYDEVSVTEMDAESIRDYDRHEETISMALIDDEEFARDIARVRLMRFKQPRTELTAISFVCGAYGSSTALLYDALMQVTIGDRVRLRETWSGHDQEYAVVGEDHEVTSAAGTHKVTWCVRSVAGERYWTIEHPERGALDGDYGLAL